MPAGPNQRTPNNIYNLAFAVFQRTVTVNQSAGAVGVTGMLFASNGYRIRATRSRCTTPADRPSFSSATARWPAAA